MLQTSGIPLLKKQEVVSKVHENLAFEIITTAIPPIVLKSGFLLTIASGLNTKTGVFFPYPVHMMVGYSSLKNIHDGNTITALIYVILFH